jgi:hypothetical protein
MPLDEAIEGVRQQVSLFLLFALPAGFVALPKAFRTMYPGFLKYILRLKSAH